jgi:hypothetical protein
MAMSLLGDGIIVSSHSIFIGETRSEGMLIGGGRGKAEIDGEAESCWGDDIVDWEYTDIALRVDDRDTALLRFCFGEAGLRRAVISCAAAA